MLSKEQKECWDILSSNYVDIHFEIVDGSIIRPLIAIGIADSMHEGIITFRATKDTFTKRFIFEDGIRSTLLIRIRRAGYLPLETRCYTKDKNITNYRMVHSLQRDSYYYDD